MYINWILESRNPRNSNLVRKIAKIIRNLESSFVSPRYTSTRFVTVDVLTENTADLSTLYIERDVVASIPVG